MLLSIDHTIFARFRPSGLDVRCEFTTDIVQEIVSQFSSEPFAVSVEILDIEGVPQVVISVPSGVTSPAITKSSLNDDGGKPLIVDNTLYVRTVAANGRVSSARIGRRDWDRLLRVLVHNRQADIGQFVRDHLAPVLDVDRIAELVPEASAAVLGAFASRCAQRFESLWSERSTGLGQYGVLPQLERDSAGSVRRNL